MPRFLLSLHTGADAPPPPEPSPEERAGFMEKIDALEAEMRASGAFVFTGGLTPPRRASVVRKKDGRHVNSDGPFAEAKEHIAGFYVIEAADREEAHRWAAKVVDAVGAPIEVREFFDTRDG